MPPDAAVIDCSSCRKLMHFDARRVYILQLYAGPYADDFDFPTISASTVQVIQLLLFNMCLPAKQTDINQCCCHRSVCGSTHMTAC